MRVFGKTDIDAAVLQTDGDSFRFSGMLVTTLFKRYSEVLANIPVPEEIIDNADLGHKVSNEREVRHVYRHENGNFELFLHDGGTQIVPGHAIKAVIMSRQHS